MNKVVSKTTKVMPLMNSGSRQNVIDLEDQSYKEVTFDNLDIYATIAEDDCLVFDHVGHKYDVKKGDVIWKSNCKEMLYVTTDDTSKKLFEEYQKQLKERDDKRKSNRKNDDCKEALCCLSASDN